MTEHSERGEEYLEAAVQRLLAENADTAEQGITVVRRDGTLVLCGEVESPQRRDEIFRLVVANYPDVPVAVDIGVTRAAAPTEVEHLP
ncbi:hypothetical protein [Micromonospora zhanjiangensis]|uniref:BON domain-containing protein n=1 Tax=Micromonospora zhanjiangensis TaxID=1522057 RepID=A0ABV8KLT5_9ACTN